jgi:hypothetical protein
MSLDLLPIDALTESLTPGALEYLSKAIPSQHRMGVGEFVIAQSKLFNQYACHLEVVLQAIQQAPKGLNLQAFESRWLEWLRENGVSSTRITQLKGAIRLKSNALAEDSYYRPNEQEIIRGLEVEKAYLFGRLTWEGRRAAFRLHQDNGKITLKDLRQLMKDYTYDPKVNWNDNWKPGITPSSAAESLVVEPKTPISMKAYGLVTSLQGIVDELLDIRHQWKGDELIFEAAGDPGNCCRVSL